MLEGRLKLYSNGGRLTIGRLYVSSTYRYSTAYWSLLTKKSVLSKLVDLGTTVNYALQEQEVVAEDMRIKTQHPEQLRQTLKDKGRLSKKTGYKLSRLTTAAKITIEDD